MIPLIFVILIGLFIVKLLKNPSFPLILLTYKLIPVIISTLNDCILEFIPLLFIKFIFEEVILFVFIFVNKLLFEFKLLKYPITPLIFINLLLPNPSSKILFSVLAIPVKVSILNTLLTLNALLLLLLIVITLAVILSEIND